MVKTLTGLAGFILAVCVSADDQKMLTEIVVESGFKKSIKSGIAQEMEADIQMEALGMGDFGSLPGRSVAEVLARMPAVTGIRDKDTGVMENIVVRGATDLTLATLNGREQVTMDHDGSRNVEYNLYPTHVLSDVQVMKTTTAEMNEGGVSGTVNMNTIRPLDYAERRFSANVELNQYAIGDDVPSADTNGSVASFTYVDQLTDNFGVAFGLGIRDESIGRVLTEVGGFDGFAGGGFGATNTAAVIAGGSRSPGSSSGAETESYNGTAWGELNDLNTARYGPGATGTTSAGLAFGGNADPNSDVTETWNGVSWTEVNDMNNVKSDMVSVGTQTSSLAAGGSGSPREVDYTELWNGTNWTEVNDLNTARLAIRGAGTTAAALAFGGESAPTPAHSNVELWNGTNWTEVNDLNTATQGPGGAGTSTAALAFGGETPVEANSAKTESWNGTNWANENPLNSAVVTHGGSGTQTAALSFAGENPPPTGATEEWNADGIITETLT